MLSKSRPLLFIIVLMGLVWGVNSFLFGPLRNSNSDELAEIVERDDFSLGLLNSTDGCVALAYRKNVDVLVIGSSHVYAGVDPSELKESLPNTDVAVCGLPAWNSDFFEPFLGYVDRHNLKPQRIVWIADSASLLELASQEQRLEAARAIFGDDAGHEQVARQWQSRIAEGQPPYLITVDDHNEKHEQFRAKLDALDLSTVRKTLAEVTVPGNALIEKVLSSARLNPRNERNFNTFCSQMQRRGIRLDIVISPFQESLFHEVEKSLGAERMGELIATADKVRAYIDCSTMEIELSLADWGLDERHFINRSAQEDYDYSIWNNAEAFNAALEDMPGRAQLRVIDPDHLNPIGAEIFTKALVEKLDIAADQQ